MKMNFDVIIIGGGIYGSVCAYFLAQQGQKVLLVEKNRVGSSGSTAYSRGIVRAYDPDKALAEISLSSAIELGQWESHHFPGINPYRASGFLYLLDEKQAGDISAFAASHHSDDYPIQLLSSREVSKRFPWIKPDPDRIGVFEEKGGYGDPRLTAVNFMEGFRAKGGQVYENCEVKGFEPTGKGGWKVQLPIGTVEAKALLFTTGAYTKRFFPELPIFTRSISLTQVSDVAGEVRLPLIDEGVETYFRPGDGASFYAGSQVFESTQSPEELAAPKAAEYQDSMRRIELLMKNPTANKAINYFKGFDSYTNEKKPIIQFLEDQQGVYLATGFSGRGYKCAIGLGRLIAAEISRYLGKNMPAQEIHWRLPLKDLVV